MKKKLVLLSSILLFASCNDDEKINEWRSFDFVPETSISESELGTLTLTHDELMEVVENVCYEPIAKYYCKTSEEGTLYRLQTEDSYNVSDITTYTVYAEYNYMVREKYVELVTKGSKEAMCYLFPYTFDELSRTINGFPLGVAQAATLMYADNEHLILQTDEVNPEFGNSDGAKFTRYVFQKRNPLDLSDCKVDTIDVRPTIPNTSLCEEAVAEFGTVTAEKFLDITGSYVYAQNMEYICYREGDNVYYKQLSSSFDDEYNVFDQLDGRPGRYVSFEKEFMTAQYEGMSDGEVNVVLEYHPFHFDEGTQTLTGKGLNGCAIEGESYKIAYIDENYIVLESAISEKAKNVFAIDDDKHYFVREILVRYTDELKEPTIVHDYRE